MGPILSNAMAALVIDPGAFKRSGDFAASLGLVPPQDGTGGKVRRDPISKRGNGYLCWLLVNGATALIKAQHRRQDRGSPSCRPANPRKRGGGGSGRQAGTHRLGVDDAPEGLRLPAAGGLSR
jgi:transposase